MKNLLLPVLVAVFSKYMTRFNTIWNTRWPTFAIWTQFQTNAEQNGEHLLRSIKGGKHV